MEQNKFEMIGCFHVMHDTIESRRVAWRMAQRRCNFVYIRRRYVPRGKVCSERSASCTEVISVDRWDAAKGQRHARGSILITLNLLLLLFRLLATTRLDRDTFVWRWLFFIFEASTFVVFDGRSVDWGDDASLSMKGLVAGFSSGDEIKMKRKLKEKWIQ